MEVKLIKQDEKSIEFQIEGLRHSIPGMLQKILADNKEVEFVSYKLEHPLDNKCSFYLKTKSGKPIKVLEDGLNQITENLNEFEEQLKKIFK